MAVRVKDITALMENIAPSADASGWDNVGLMTGDTEHTVNTVLIALDCTDDVIDEAVGMSAEMIITHHPLIFKPIKSVTNQCPEGRRILKLIQNNISVYSAHTNLDIADGGTNDIVFDMLGLINKEYLWVDEERIGRIGELPKPICLRVFAEKLRKQIGGKCISYSGNGDKKVEKIGLCTGSASGYKYFSAAAANGCDTYISGDISYHEAQMAGELGLMLINAPHFATEIHIVKGLCEALSKKQPNVRFIEAKMQQDIFNYTTGMGSEGCE